MNLHMLRPGDMFCAETRATFKPIHALLYIGNGRALTVTQRIMLVDDRCSLKSTLQSAGAAEKAKSSALRRAASAA